MLLKKIAELKSSLLFQMAALYVATFTVLAIIGSVFFGYRIYLTAISLIDKELCDEIRHYSKLVSRSGYAALKTKLMQEGAAPL